MRNFLFFLAYFLALQIIALKARIKPHALESMQRILACERNYLCLFENKHLMACAQKYATLIYRDRNWQRDFLHFFINSWIIAKCEPRFNILPCTQALWGLRVCVCVCECANLNKHVRHLHTRSHKHTHTLALAFNKYKRHSSLSAYVRCVL